MSVVFDLLAQLIQLYIFLLLGRVLVSWVPNLDPSNPIVQFLYRATDPILEPARRIIPPIGMVDISPIIVFFVLQFLVRILHDLARTV